MSGNPHGDETFEPQYHPKVELGNIYGSANWLKAKANDADNVVGNDSEEDHNNRDSNIMHLVHTD